jgi:hypothetical protein
MQPNRLPEPQLTKLTLKLGEKIILVGGLTGPRNKGEPMEITNIKVLIADLQEAAALNGV